MPLNNLDHKKIYYYVICVMAFFVLMWGAIDLTSSSIGLVSVNSSSSSLTVPREEAGEVSPPEKGDQLFDVYYQKKMLQDRLFDSLARIIISGAIFVFCRRKIDALDSAA
jgi:hypothetical protein